MKTLRPPTPSVNDVAGDLKRLSAAAAHECVLVEHTTLGISYLADEKSGVVYNIPTESLPSPHLPLGQRIRFQVSEREEIVNVELVS